ncbi:MAG: hypothetical protein H6727_04270 [Myxococcales bacterium]|nr:hypothetical protein [Myxococcales bacterium]
MQGISKTQCYGILGLCLLFLGASGLTSCSTPTDPNNNKTPDVIDLRVQIPEAPKEDEGRQFIMPETIIPAGSEKMMCWIPNWVPDKDYLVTQFEGVQGRMGHHVVALRSGVPRKAGEVFDCTETAKMTSLQPLVLPDPEGEKLLKPGYAVVMPKDSKIVIQSHYVNTETRDIKVADVARLHFAPKDISHKIVSYYLINHGAVNVVPGESKATLSCQIKRAKKFMLLFGHMHDYGREIRIELERDGQRTEIYKIDKWNVDFRDRPPITFFNTPDELSLQPGDKLHVECGYKNATSDPIRFPSEMCTAVAYYYAEDHNDIINCDGE